MMNVRTTLGLLACLGAGCFNPDEASGDTDTDTDPSSADGSTTSPPTTDPTLDTDTNDTEMSTTDMSTTDVSTTNVSTTDVSATDASSTTGAPSSSDESSTGDEPVEPMCGDGVVVASEVCFEAFHEVMGDPYRFAYLQDIDLDGDDDLFYSATSGEVIVQFNGEGVFGLETMSNFDGVSTLDAAGFTNFNGDTVLDAVLMSGSGGVLYAVSGNTSGAFAIEDGEGTEAYAIAVGDMDGVEGDEAVVMVLAGIDVLSIADDGTLETISNANVDDFTPATDVQLADLNSDDQLDVIYLGPFGDDGDNSQVRAQLGSGDGSLSNVELSPLLESDAAQDLVVGDFDGDGNVDLAVADDSVVRVAFGNGALAFTQVNFAVASGTASRLAAADVDLDGIDDIIVGYSDREALSVFLGSAAQSFATGVDIELSHTTENLSTGEINGDGVPDIVASTSAQAALTVVQSTN